MTKCVTKFSEQTVCKVKAMLSDQFPFSAFWKWHLLNDSFLTEVFEAEIDF